ncbi:hypothetical protein K502DRAFT_302691 [Neoconidiobolus thromboides FSU 785]|nr:hypothetical protein K502DRAFT_302691 [Neoconidiobolus thromboides FSU 785]
MSLINNLKSVLTKSISTPLRSIITPLTTVKSNYSTFPVDDSQSQLFYNTPDYKQHKYSGRSVITTDDPMRAYYRLNGILKNNNVRKQLVRHRYYEKPCLKRRRLVMESNRRRFKEVVARKVAMVMQLKNRGV